MKIGLFKNQVFFNEDINAKVSKVHDLNMIFLLYYANMGKLCYGLSI